MQYFDDFVTQCSDLGLVIWIDFFQAASDLGSRYRRFTAESPKVLLKMQRWILYTTYIWFLWEFKHLD